MKTRSNRSPIDRRRFLQGSMSLAVAAALGRLEALGAQQGPQTSMTEIRRGTGMFTGRGGTIGWYIDNDALIVVDTQMPGTAEICVEELGKRSSRMIDLLINSHHHGDHTGGNGIFRPKVRKILAHKNVPGLQKAAAERSNRTAGQVYADATFGEVWREELGKETVALRYWGPAHTGGDAVIHFERANVVHMGDLVFNRIAPYIDTFGGSRVSNWVVVLEKTVKQFDADTQYIFGHGSAEHGVLGTRADVLMKRDFLSAAVEHVRRGIAKGASAEEVSAIDELKGFEPYSSGNSRDRFKSGLREIWTQETTGERP